MRRREFIAGLGSSAVALPLIGHAQQADRRRIGILMQVAQGDPEGHTRLAAFREQLQKLGWRVGGNLQIDYRWDTSNDERARAAAGELLALAPDVILANTTVALRAVQQATRLVPIVFTLVTEPVGQGFVASLAHPGGNITGFSYIESSVGGKQLDLLKKIAPRVTHVAFMFNPERSPYSLGVSQCVAEAARRFAVQYVPTPVHEPAEIETVMTMLAREPGGGLIVSADTFTVTNSQLIIDLTARYGVPAIYAERNFVADGALISYGADYVDHFRQAAIYVDRILRGEKPDQLPVQQPAKYQLAINLKTAKALGLEIPETWLAIADEVIK